MSIWLNQAVKGYRDKSGNALTNAHLLGLFHRLCKLLFYRIKPVFVFDGKAPELKKETLQRRRIRKGDATKKAKLTSAKILDNYVRSQAVAHQLKQQTHAINKVLARGQEGIQDVLGQRTKKLEKDLFELPPSQEDDDALEDSDDNEEYREDLLRQLNVTDIHQMDVKSKEFLDLPKEIQYELLSELTERRKQSSWNKLHEMPKSASGFSGFQLERLINRQRVQKTKENVGKQIGHESAMQMDSNLFVGDIQGIKKAKAEAKRVMSSSSGAHYVLLQGLSQSQRDDANDDDDDEVEILEPTNCKSSNRCGGLLSLKKEVIDSESEEDDIYQDEILKVIQSEAAVSKLEPQPGPSKSTELTSSSDDEDDFEDVETSNTTTAIQIDFNPTKQIAAEDDIFADIFEGEKKDEDINEQNESTENDISGDEEDASKNMAETMKQSDHLYLKIASKYLEQPKAEPEKKPPIEEDDPFDELDKETDNLIREMKANENEQRLLKIKNLDQLQSDETTASKNILSMKDHSTSKVLSGLGVSSIPQDEYEKRVSKELTKEENGVFGDAVSGFTRSKQDQNVQDAPDLHDDVEIDHSILSKLDQEGEEFSQDELLELQNKLAKEQQGLIAERGQLERLSATITDQMYAECQELLQLFGIPWIVAPSEAEAQCAFLDMNNLTHGTITDDSDVWVFGGQRIYKNFFNQDKHCEFFTSTDVAKHFGLSREKLILLALLTGSDYTDGVESVGPVTALEILAEFPGPGLTPLKLFKSWWDESHKNVAAPPGSKLREKLRRLQLPENFPSERISSAYTNPEVDNSSEKFTWAIPNFVAIRDFATEKFGWSRGKVDEIIKPMIKKMSVKVSQERIDNFFTSTRISLPEKGQFQASKRVKQAIGKFTGVNPEKEKSPAVKRLNSRERKTAKKTKIEARVAPKANVETGPPIATVKPPVDWKAEEKKKAEEAKKKAIEVMKKFQAAKKAKRGKKAEKRNVVKRVVMADHNLSESDSSD